jgi:DNA-binding NtrC family response regulator
MTMKNFDRIVILDDDPFFGKLIANFLKNQDYKNVVYYESEADCLASINQQERSLFLLDHHLSNTTGLQTMERIQILNESSRFIIISGQEYCHVAIKAIKQGAIDYIEKNKFTLLRLGNLLRKAIENESNNVVFQKNVERELIEHRSSHFSKSLKTTEEYPHADGRIGY